MTSSPTCHEAAARHECGDLAPAQPAQICAPRRCGRRVQSVCGGFRQRRLCVGDRDQAIAQLQIAESWHRTLMSLDFEHLPVTAEHAVGVEALPWHHRDPFDRLLVAQGLAENAILVTADRTLDRYPVPTWWGGPIPG